MLRRERAGVERGQRDGGAGGAAGPGSTGAADEGDGRRQPPLERRGEGVDAGLVALALDVAVAEEQEGDVRPAGKNSARRSDARFPCGGERGVERGKGGQSGGT
jgi:hypothetical protein